MTHPIDELTALLDGALPEPRRAEVARHLAGCAPCRAERDRLRAALDVLARLPVAPEPSPTFEARLSARLARERRPGLLARLGALRWRLFGPAAALGACAMVAVGVVRHQRAQERELAAHLDLLLDYEVVASVGDVESADDADLVAHLDELAKEAP